MTGNPQQAEIPHQTLRWGHFAEDRAQAQFLETIFPMMIRHFASSTFDIVQDTAFTQLQASSWKQVSKYAGEACIEAERRGLNVCVVVRDLEEVNCVRTTWQEAFTSTMRQLRESIPEKARPISCIGIPVKTIEYWLWYVQHFLSGEAVQPQSLEEYPQSGKREDNLKTAKEVVYDYPRGSVKSATQEKKVITEICARINPQLLEQLATHSPSFQSFFGEVQQRVHSMTTSTLA